MLKQNVLRKKADFDKLYKKGSSAADRYVVIFAIPNGKEIKRTGFLASKKVGKSVERNRARRLMKESFRRMEDIIPDGMDIVFIARNTIAEKKQEEVEKSMRSAWKKLSKTIDNKR